MKYRIKQLRKVLSDVLYVSKQTGTTNKKVTILLAIFASNLTAILDIAIILILTLFFTGEFETFRTIELAINFLDNNMFLLPLVIIVRFSSKLFQNYLIKTLEVTVMKNLKVNVMTQIFKEKDFSTSDAFFYTNQITTHVSFFYSSLTNFLNFLLQAIVYFLYLLFSNPTMVSAFAVGVLLLIIPIKKLLVNSKNFMHKAYIFEKKSNEEIQRVIENLYLIKILDKDKDEIKKFSNTLDEFANGELKKYIYNVLSSDFPSFITIFTFSIFIYYFGDFTFITLDYIAITLRLFQSLGATAGAFGRVLNSQIHIKELKFVLDGKQVNLIHDYKFSTKLGKNDIVFSSVNFKYRNSSEWIFQNLDLEILNNTHTVITGQNGSGKSTLLGLISGMLIHESGSIRLAKNKLGYIGPNPLILSTTLRENLLYGNDTNVDEKTILELCEKFELDKNISSDLLDKEVSNKSLSSGQMQKVGFIRAILANSQVLLLDEATSNLDRNTKLLILDILTSKNITIVNSTHDPTSFRKVDRHIQIDIIENRRKVYDV